MTKPASPSGVMNKKYTYEPSPKCPHCDCEIQEAWELNMSDGDAMELECPDCGAPYLVICSITIYYDSEPIPPEDGGEVTE